MDIGNWEGLLGRRQASRNETRDPNAWQKEAGLSYKEDSRTETPVSIGETQRGPAYAYGAQASIYELANKEPKEPEWFNTYFPNAGKNEPQLTVGEQDKQKRDARNARRRARNAENKGHIETGKAVKAQHGPDATAENLMPATDAIWALEQTNSANATAGKKASASRTPTRTNTTQQQLF
jgi:hypothetical protein